MQYKLECGPMPNVMATLPNIGGTLCSMPQNLGDAHYWSAVQYHWQDAKPAEISWGAPNYRTHLSRQSATVHHIVGTSGGDIAA